MRKITFIVLLGITLSGVILAAGQSEIKKHKHRLAHSYGILDENASWYYVAPADLNSNDTFSLYMCVMNPNKHCTVNTNLVPDSLGRIKKDPARTFAEKGEFIIPY